MKKIIFIVFLLPVFFCTSYAQEDDVIKAQIESLNQSKEAFKLRKTFLTGKNPYFYDESNNKFKSCEEFINDLQINYSDKIDTIFFNIISEAIKKELNTSKEDITKLSKDKKNHSMTENGKHEMTQGEMMYYTFLLFIQMKIDDKLKELSE